MSGDVLAQLPREAVGSPCLEVFPLDDPIGLSDSVNCGFGNSKHLYNLCYYSRERV